MIRYDIVPQIVREEPELRELLLFHPDHGPIVAGDLPNPTEAPSAATSDPTAPGGKVKTGSPYTTAARRSQRAPRRSLPGAFFVQAAVRLVRLRDYQALPKLS